MVKRKPKPLNKTELAAVLRDFSTHSPVWTARLRATFKARQNVEPQHKPQHPIDVLLKKHPWPWTGTAFLFDAKEKLILPRDIKNVVAAHRSSSRRKRK